MTEREQLGTEVVTETYQLGVNETDRLGREVVTEMDQVGAEAD